MIEKKVCIKCKEEKEISMFSFYRKKHGSYQSRCKLCASEDAKKYYYKSHEKGKEIRRSYYYKNRKELISKNYRNSLKYYFGITVEDYMKMLDEQDECCAICKKHKSNFKKRLSVDHNHVTGKVRGLLCFDRNTGIGRLLGDITTELLENAITYIKNTEEIAYE